MEKSTNIKTILIALGIGLASILIIEWVRPMITWVSQEVWKSLTISFALAYLLVAYSEKELKDKKVTTYIKNYIMLWLFVFGIFVGINYLFKFLLK